MQRKQIISWSFSVVYYRKISRYLGVYGKAIFRELADEVISKRNLVALISEYFPGQNHMKIDNYARKLWYKMNFYNLIDETGLTKFGKAYRRFIKDHDEITYTKILRLGFAPYRIDVKPEQRWFKHQYKITVLLPYPTTMQGVKLFPYGTYHSMRARHSMRCEIDYKHRRIRLVGRTCGSVDGRVGLGDITPWIYYKKVIK